MKGHRPVLLIPDPPPSLALPPRDGRVRQLCGETMGTIWHVSLVEPAAGLPLDAIEAAIRDLFDRICAAMSTWRADSEISRFNRAAVGTRQRLSPDFVTVLDRALAIARETSGAFDPTVGPAVDAWGFGPAGPAATAHDAAGLDGGPPPPVGRWRELRIDRGRRTLTQPGGVGLDLSGIAKGYAVDRMASLLSRWGAPAFLAEIGGEFVAHGLKPDLQPWWLALEHPVSHSGAAGDHGAPTSSLRTSLPPTILAATNQAVASSGDYRRCRHDGNRTVSHVIAPNTGRPAARGVARVTVVAGSCIDADAYATALVAMGPEAGPAFANSKGLAAQFVLREPSGLRAQLTPAMAVMAT